jgi:integrase
VASGYGVYVDTRKRTPVAKNPGIYLESTTRGDRYVVKYRDHLGRQRSKSFGTLVEARTHQAANLVDRDRGSGLRPSSDRITFAEFAIVVRDRNAHWRPSTVTQWNAKQKRLDALLGHRLVTRIRTGDIAEVLATAKRDGLADSYIASLRHQIGSIFRAALADEIVARNPTEALPRRKGTRSSDARKAALTPEQFSALYEALPARVRPYAVLMATTGLRPSEAAGITADRLDLLHRRVRIDRQLLGYVEGEPTFGPPKTASSVRTVILSDAAVTSIEASLAEYGVGKLGLVFGGPRLGTPLTRSLRGAIWRDAADGLDLPDAARGWHSLRHTFATSSITNGVDPVTVAASIGHSDASMTLSVYAHTDDDAVEAARNVAADVILAKVNAK